MKRFWLFISVSFFVLSAALWATVFGSLRGVVHDPDHRPMKGARVVVGCWFRAGETNAKSLIVEYWYQLLDKAPPPTPGVVPPTQSAVPQEPVLGPTPAPRPGLY